MNWSSRATFIGLYGEGIVYPSLGGAGLSPEILREASWWLGSKELDLPHFGNDRMVSAGAGWLGADDFGDLELPLRVSGAHDGLKFPRFWRSPRVGPDDPGIGRHGRLDPALVPRAACIEA